MLHFTYSNLYHEAKDLVIQDAESFRNLLIDTIKILGKIEDKANYRNKLKWTV